MSRVLPKELQTKKVKSLQGDLKNIAEELIAEKFGIEEEVVERRYSPDDFAFRGGPVGGHMSVTTQVTLGGVHQLIDDAMRYANASRHHMGLYMSVESWQRLQREAGFHYATGGGFSLFGVEVNVSPIEASGVVELRVRLY